MARQRKVMDYIIKSDVLEVAVRSQGAELRSIKGSDGVEYLWQGDPAFWSGRAPNLFPYIGRLIDGHYTFKGKSYDLPKHGFLRDYDLPLVEKTDDSVSFILVSNDETREMYPFDFSVVVSYKVEGAKIINSFVVKNMGQEEMIYALGAHPAFNVPIGDDKCEFKDYTLTFDSECAPKRQLFSDDVFITGETEDYPLVSGKTMTLYDGIFDNDAVVLKGAASSVCLSSPSSKKSITMSYPDTQYIGFWHMAFKRPPYICIEPWTSLQASEGGITDFEKQADLQKLESGTQKEIVFTITIE